MRSPGTFDLRAALSDELRAAIEELDTSSDHRAVHRCRVRVKRARALARVGRAGAPGLSSVFNDTARGVMRMLAQARDLQALALAARKLAKRSGKKAAAALERVAEHLDRARHACPSLDVEAARSGLKDLLALAQVWPEASPRQVTRGAKRVARRARRARRRGYHATTPARRHEWRKREKDRLYAALLLDDAWPCARRRKIGAKLGEALGQEHDMILLLDHLRAAPELAGDGEGPARALRALKRRRKQLSRRADALGSRLHARGA